MGAGTDAARALGEGALARSPLCQGRRAAEREQAIRVAR
jgi:hypothetical protein